MSHIVTYIHTYIYTYAAHPTHQDAHVWSLLRFVGFIHCGCDASSGRENEVSWAPLVGGGKVAFPLAFPSFGEKCHEKSKRNTIKYHQIPSIDAFESFECRWSLHFLNLCWSFEAQFHAEDDPPRIHIPSIHPRQFTPLEPDVLGDSLRRAVLILPWWLPCLYP